MLLRLLEGGPDVLHGTLKFEVGISRAFVLGEEPLDEVCGVVFTATPPAVDCLAVHDYLEIDLRQAS